MIFQHYSYIHVCNSYNLINWLKQPKVFYSGEGSGTKATGVDKSTLFTVHTVYQNGQFCKQVVDAELKSVVNDSIIHARVISKGKGVYEVTYTPEVRRA